MCLRGWTELNELITSLELFAEIYDDCAWLCREELKSLTSLLLAELLEYCELLADDYEYCELDA